MKLQDLNNPKMANEILPKRRNDHETISTREVIPERQLEHTVPTKI